MRSYLILGMCALYLIQYFIAAEVLQYLAIALAFIAFLGSSKKADRFPRTIGLLMMMIGIVLEWSKGTGIAGIKEGIFMILPVICLIALAPMLSIPLKISGFFTSVSQLMQVLLNQPKKLYAGITGTLFFLSPILNLGSVRVLNDFLEELKLPPLVSAKSYLVGFTTALMWSPYFASVSLVLHYLDVPFNEYVLYGLGFSLLSLLIGNILFALWEKRHPLEVNQKGKVLFHKRHRKKLSQLAIFVVLLICSCLFIEYITGWSMIVIVCLLSILIPLLFAIKRSNRAPMLPLLRDFRDRTIPMMNNEIMLFMSAGMLAFALQGTNYANAAGDFLAGLANISFFLFAVVILLIVLFLTYLGIHQIAVIGALAMQLSTIDIGMPNLGLALLLMLIWAVSAAMSPFSGLNLMVSRFSGISGFHIGFRAYGLQMVVFSIIGITIISFL